VRSPDVQPCCGNGARLLPAGPPRIAVYADASYADAIGTGSWAFSVPALGTVMSGVEPGSSVNRLEVSAAVHGIRFVACKDQTDRPLVVYTDSEVVIRVLDCVRKRAEMPDKPFYYYWVINEHFSVELFCGITPLRARPTGEAFRGIYARPGDCRGTRRSTRAFEGLLQRSAVAR
jgi:hypothetical protein